MAEFTFAHSAHDTAASTYRAFASAWNSHAELNNWAAAGALLVGCAAALVLLLLLRVVSDPHATLRLEWPVAVLVSPQHDQLPQLRVLRVGRERQAPVRATPAQWNKMRAALGPQVWDKEVVSMLRKHGDDVEAAAREYHSVSKAADGEWHLEPATCCCCCGRVDGLQDWVAFAEQRVREATCSAWGCSGSCSKTSARWVVRVLQLLLCVCSRNRARMV